MRMLRSWLMVAICFAAGLVGGATSARFAGGAGDFSFDAPRTFKTISAREFRLVGRFGATYARIGRFEDGGLGLELADGAGNTRTVLSLLADDRPALVLSDARGRKRAVLLLEEDGSPGFGLFGGEGELRAKLVLEGDSAGLLLANAEGRQRAALAVDPDGSARLELLDKEGQEIWPKQPEAE